MATATQPLLETMAETKEEQVVRFDIHQRLQHIAMFISFTMLALTGLPQKFNTWAISQWWVSLLGGIESVRSLHHFFAWVMLGDALYHALYLFVNTIIRKRPLPLSMIPSLKDFQGLYQEVRHFVGLSHEEPKYDRFNWREKFDYWAVFWGIPILGISGLILMFPVQATRILPGAAIPMALVAHSDEAFLAVAWIFGVHLFFTHLTPGVFPLNKSIFTGRISKSKLIKEHPLEWERLRAALVSPKAEVAPASLSSFQEAVELLASPATDGVKLSYPHQYAIELPESLGCLSQTPAESTPEIS